MNSYEQRIHSKTTRVKQYGRVYDVVLLCQIFLVNTDRLLKIVRSI